VRRREFISLFGGTAIAWPLAAHAQQSRDRARGIGVLIPEDAETEALVVAFRQRFQELGWTQGRNVQFDYRYTDGNPERTRSALQGANAGPTMSANDVLISAPSVLPSPHWPSSPVH